MRLFSRALVLGVLVPAALSNVFYSSLGDRDDRGEQRMVRVERAHNRHAPHPPRHGPQWAPPPPHVAGTGEDGRIEIGALDPDDGDLETRVDLGVRLPMEMRVTIHGSPGAPPPTEALGF